MRCSGVGAATAQLWPWRCHVWRRTAGGERRILVAVHYCRGLFAQCADLLAGTVPVYLFLPGTGPPPGLAHLPVLFPGDFESLAVDGACFPRSRADLFFPLGLDLDPGSRPAILGNGHLHGTAWDLAVCNPFAQTSHDGELFRAHRRNSRALGILHAQGLRRRGPSGGSQHNRQGRLCRLAYPPHCSSGDSLGIAVTTTSVARRSQADRQTDSDWPRADIPGQHLWPCSPAGIPIRVYLPGSVPALPNACLVLPGTLVWYRHAMAGRTGDAADSLRAGIARDSRRHQHFAHGNPECQGQQPFKIDDL